MKQRIFFLSSNGTQKIEFGGVWRINVWKKPLSFALPIIGIPASGLGPLQVNGGGIGTPTSGRKRDWSPELVEVPRTPDLSKTKNKKSMEGVHKNPKFAENSFSPNLGQP